ncbi:MAG: CBS domain-containing protein [Candidatus Marinimicrobia bacterium]|jgi:chloride channel protein, CIC family|nr:CBS domain-containing protein [Candidatus Neomarinimicrobiota bacterium]MBT3632158.1 CBS domain-containing protein [Candidatus Neomarinimicrobiota bacterium]MBT3824288.1 CBS domain-containing protein [Candidatus Neomarinimicrobiota bacterium]MBT4129109.1 CBS domain-containing protein [Candidatus Neomarinimicrobiota bacterium]MBT4295662.1 CBS domain-containing protein [Candidatus Neomarinimicrobiota bacterium]
MNTAPNKAQIKKLRRQLNQRRARYVWLQNILFKIKSFDQLFVMIMAMLIGVFAGVISAGFRTLIDSFRHGLWGEGALIDVAMAAPIYLKIGIPAFGGAVVAWSVKRFAPEAKGHGVPEVMNAVATQNGFIRMRVVIIKAFASAMSIASGASVGREGPIVQIGSAFGSTIGQLFQVSIRRMKTFIGCGAAAGIAATFNAPIAGAIFASEVILGDFSAAAIGPIIIASVFGTVISRGLYGDFPAFIPPTYTLHSPVEIIFYIILGVATGVVGWLFVRSLYKTEDLFDAWEAPVALKGLLGGAVLGGMAVYLPQILGVGYESMESVLNGHLGFTIAFGLVLAKILATSLSMGFGASGGVFAPSLFIGSMLGGALGTIIHSLFPEITASSGAYALVGMAAMVAATTHAPVTAVLIIFEMTTEYTVILPLMITSIIAMVISSRLLNGSNIYTLKLIRRGIDIFGGKDINVLDKISVRTLKKKIVDTVSESMTLQELLEKISISSASNFYVKNEDNRLSGIITHSAMRRYLNHHEEIPADATVRDMMNRQFEIISDTTPVHEVLRKMKEMDLEALPVVDDALMLNGEVERSAIVHQYQELLIHAESAKAVAHSMKFIQKQYHEKSEVLPGFFLARINTPSTFVNQSLRSLNVRQVYGVDILLVRRSLDGEEKDLIPDVNDKLHSSDQLLIFGEQAKVELLCSAH